jgi:hypothetical protein
LRNGDAASVLVCVAGDDGNRRRASDGESGEADVERSSVRDYVSLLGIDAARRRTKDTRRQLLQFLDGRIVHETLCSLI